MILSRDNNPEVYMIKSSNPALRADTYCGFGYIGDRAATMSIQGVVFKTAISLLLLMLTAGYTWTKFYQSGQNPTSISLLTMVGLLGGLVLAVATMFKKEWAAITTPLYALFQGLLIGGLSAI